MAIFLSENNGRKDGFTLIELLVVISIIAVMASIVMSSLQSSRQKAFDSQIKSDLTQIRNALELYGNDNNYVYPTVISLASGSTSSSSVAVVTPSSRVTMSTIKSHSVSVFDIISKIKSVPYFNFTKEVVAAGTRDQNCTYFDNLTSVLVPKYIGALPKHPLDNGVDVCYRYFATDSGNQAVAYGSLVSETYSNGLNKQTGVSLGKIDIESLQNICTANLNSGSGLGQGSLPFPLFSGGGNQCQGVVADEVLGVTAGQGDVIINFSCSDPQYGNETDCQTEHSYCSDPQYTNSTDCESHGVTTAGSCADSNYTDESSCISVGYYSGAGCSNWVYTDESSCVNAGYYSGGGCSDANYSDESSCVNAGYSSGYCNAGGYYDESSCVNAGYYSGGGCSNSSYYDSSSCTGAGYYGGGGCSGGGYYYDQSSCESAGYSPSYCSGGDYYDESSCVNAICSYSPVYCSDGYSSNADDCANNGGYWYSEQPNYCGYSWYQGSPSYGYTWYPEQWYSYGYSWSDPTYYSYGYQWYTNWYLYGYSWSQPTWYSENNSWNSGTWTNYGYAWTPGQYTQNTWTYVPPGVWGSS